METVSAVKRKWIYPYCNVRGLVTNCYDEDANQLGVAKLHDADGLYRLLSRAQGETRDGKNTIRTTKK